MRNLTTLLTASSVVAALAMAGCGDDSGSTTGGGTTGGNAPGTQELSGNIDTDLTLTADTEWILTGIVKVQAGATLTIEKGTTIYGDTTTSGTLVVQRGAKIMAEGTADEPIVFTSQLPEGERAAGDWGGVIILGKAPINEPGGEASVEGLSSDEAYGGTSATDSSGVFRYVRIEFSGIEISPDNEINGLTLGGVGSGTTIDHVMVRYTLDDCFEFFGGTVNASHLICYRNGDDGFDFDEGYVGNLQFLFLQQDPNIADDANGFEADNDEESPDAKPVTNPTIFNVTLIGQNKDQAKQQYGMLLRRGFNATIGNAVVSGFEAGVDVRDAPFTDVTLGSTVFFGNTAANVAYVEDGSNDAELDDDDGGFDELAWFTEGEGNTEEDPKLKSPFATTPDARPDQQLPGEAPPGGFFDSSATYCGAFRDASDDWAEGAWVDWSTP